MNITTARKLHERRFRASPTMSTGEILNLIGAEGMQEAMLNRWLVADMDTGFLTLNTGGGKLLELEHACRCACGKMDCACPGVVEAAVPQSMPMREAFAGPGMGGNSHAAPTGSPTGTPAPVMPRPAPGAPTSPAPTPTLRMGDDALVREDNKTYIGKVSSVGQDGRYRLSFGSEKPRMDREYGPGELLPASDSPTHA